MIKEHPASIQARPKNNPTQQNTAHDYRTTRTTNSYPKAPQQITPTTKTTTADPQQKQRITNTETSNNKTRTTK